MGFSFTDEQELFRKSVRALCERELAPRAAEIDEKGEIPREIITGIGSAGLLGVTISERFGGSEGGFVKAAIVAEEIARAEISMGAAVYFVVEAGWGFLLDRYGTAGKVFEDGTSYIKKRKVFKTPLAGFQGIQFQLSENHLKLESARLLVYKAAWMLDRMYGEGRFSHKEINKAVVAAKLAAPTAAFEIIKDVMMWHGAYGYTKAAGLERGLRGVASYLMGAEGAQNIMKIIIARDILGKEFFTGR